MSKTSSGLFSGTKGSKTGNNTRTSLSPAQIKSTSHESVKSWAERKQRELTGKAKKTFNTASVVYDEETGKYYYGRNGGYREKGYKQNPVLFGDSTHEGLLPKSSLNKYPIGNCAEVDAINHALNAGADINHLHITTIHTTKSQFGKYKEQVRIHQKFLLMHFLLFLSCYRPKF